MPLPEWIGTHASGFLVSGAGVVVVLLLLVLFREGIGGGIARASALLPERVRALFLRSATSALATLDVLRARQDALNIALCSILIWATAAFTNYAVLRALGIGTPWIAAVLVLVVLQIGISLSTVPATLGVFEYLCVLSLAVFGVGEVQALGFGIVLHALVLLPILVGLFFFWNVRLSLRVVTQQMAPSDS